MSGAFSCGDDDWLSAFGGDDSGAEVVRKDDGGPTSVLNEMSADSFEEGADVDG